MRVMLVFGTRPEAVKMAPVYHAMVAAPEFEPRVCVTGQHRAMLDQFLKLFEIKTDFDLAIMQAGQDLSDILARALVGLRDAINQDKPDLIMVQGDTTTALAGALAGFYTKTPVAHLEAGLRTFNLQSPFPEEGNRALISRVTDYHFAPTSTSQANLLREGIPAERIWVTGNTVIDALFWMRERNAGQSDWSQYFDSAAPAVASNRPLLLVTGHRRENFGRGFEEICRSLKTLAERHADWSFVYPVHLNPNVRGPVFDLLGNIPNIHLIQPLEYPAFVHLMGRARLILTDSGGVQEEAPSLGKPVLVMRDTTERPEAVEAGTVRLVGTSSADIIAATEELMSDSTKYDAMSRAHNPYGDGHAAARILAALKEKKKS